MGSCPSSGDHSDPFGVEAASDPRPAPKMKRLLWSVLAAGALLALLTAAPTICRGQGIGIFLRHDRLAEYGAGAGLNVLSRGPWIAKGWRRVPIRFVGVQLTSYAYERLFDYAGFSWSDYRQVRCPAD